MREGGVRTPSPAVQAARRRDVLRRRRRLLLVLGAVVAAVAAVSLYRAVAAGRHALRAKSALLSAEHHLGQRELEPARAELVAAKSSLAKVEGELDGLGPLLAIAKATPVVRSQVRAVETFQVAGTGLSDAGIQLVDAAQKVLDTTKGGAPLSGAVDNLRGISASLSAGSERVRVASGRVEKLRGKWLIGPLAEVRDDFLERLPRFEQQATSTASGVEALVRFLGGDGPRRYLFLSQNPDEIRPTGGFIGTYGVLTATPGDLALDRFEPIGKFRERHPAAVVPAAEAGSPFRFARAPVVQSIANVNNVPDFTRAGALAVRLWNEAGEPPVDGVVSFTPSVLARVLGVLGPVVVPDYGETVDQANLIERFDFYTLQFESDPNADIARKGFLGSLAEVVFGRLLGADSSQWQALAEALGQSFAARELMVWSSDPQVSATLAERGWDGVLPEADGDFFYNGEFSYAAKIDRSLRRTFDHHVQLRADGSAKVTTVLTITNPRDRGVLNPGSLSYVTLYGPAGAVLAPESDSPASTEPAISGHPAAGWFLNAPARGRASVKVVWDVKDMTSKAPDGARRYSLHWLRVPDHEGDVLNLRVDLPRGWSWSGAPPPGQVELRTDLKGSWLLAPRKT